MRQMFSHCIFEDYQVGRVFPTIGNKKKKNKFCFVHLEDVQKITKLSNTKYNPNIPNYFYMLSSILQTFLSFLSIWWDFLAYQFPDASYFWYISAPQNSKFPP